MDVEAGGHLRVMGKFVVSLGPHCPDADTTAPASSDWLQGDPVLALTANHGFNPQPHQKRHRLSQAQ